VISAAFAATHVVEHLNKPSFPGSQEIEMQIQRLVRLEVASVFAPLTAIIALIAELNVRLTTAFQSQVMPFIVVLILATCVIPAQLKIVEQLSTMPQFMLWCSKSSEADMFVAPEFRWNLYNKLRQEGFAQRLFLGPSNGSWVL
jgi:hypothetical protein